jgi:hypothetical protein
VLLARIIFYLSIGRQIDFYVRRIICAKGDAYGREKESISIIWFNRDAAAKVTVWLSLRNRSPMIPTELPIERTAMPGKDQHPAD